jgi:hypothetical protein
MQPILTTTEEKQTTQTNGYVKQPNGTPSKPIMKTEEKIVLPVEMASMVSLKSLIGKLVHKSYSDLMTLTDT